MMVSGTRLDGQGGGGGVQPTPPPPAYGPEVVLFTLQTSMYILQLYG